MATVVGAAAVYARISSDTEGRALGVTRQLEDCRRLADSLGWPVAQEYVDNDLSAYSGKRRPAYEQLLADLAEGLRDAVICYHVDRLTRRPVELEQFVATVDAAGVRQVRFVSGDMDLGTGDGLLIGRIMAAVAANESAAKSRRVLRKLDQIAAEGRPHGGNRRPFGYEDDRVTVRPDEAEVIRQLVARYLAGESLRFLCSWLESNGVRTTTGGEWHSPSLRGVLKSGRIAGLREHRGEVVGPAVWDAIISPADRDRVLARMAEAAVTGRRSPRRYLLSGLLRCGRCGGKLFSSPRGETRRYVCVSGPDHGGGCGRLTVVAEPVEQLLVEAVLQRLDSPQLAQTLTGRGGDVLALELSDGLAADQEQLDELAVMFGKQEISAREWRAARQPIERRMTDRQRQLTAATSTEALAGLPGNSGPLRQQWAELSLTRQAAIVSAVIDHAVIAPGQPGSRSLDPTRVRPVWRL
ncbi:recombinase family protein [Modestobacter italicus]|uniref:recombinase family protein n=1 Tax=Modestobacter italicus (strain DSM 44449 / CECT 9708 / BC 501) TaxID=2732864 RepID=UPI001C97C91D|nr:recombinase family protein [Modestobacter italicus]